MSGPLQGCRVIELAHIMAGPIAGLMLADMGADVIKVEKFQGDDTRRMVPPVVGDQSAAFMMMNRNKRGVAIDLKSSQGREILLEMISQSDVLIENYRRGTMEKLGLGYDTLSEINPGLVYLEISGFGRTGPYQDRGGFDLIAQGMSGLMSVTGEGEGRPPVKVGAPVTDITAGILGAMGVSAAYAYKLKTGEGQKVDTSLFEAGITHTYWQSAIAFATGEAPGAMGSAHPLNAPYQAFLTSDGWINVGAANQKNWERLTEIIEKPELKQDPRFIRNMDRMKNLHQLEEELNSVFMTATADYWLEKLELGGVPAGPILDVIQMHNDPQTLARDMVVEQEHITAGKTKVLGLPVKFSKVPGSIDRAAPVLGQHTREVLEEFGYSGKTITEFFEQGIVEGFSAHS
jgi:crotonobetainyl-CoA:carnitine CoA-transferase CaiB-like acyl-CoA transferase